MTCTIFRTRLSRSGCPCGKSARCETFAEVKSMADPLGHAAAHAPQPMQAAASIAKSAWCFGTVTEFASGAEPARAEMKPPACTMRSSALRSITKSFTIGSVGFAIDRERAGAANSFATIGVERDRFLAGPEQIFVQNVEHFEK